MWRSHKDQNYLKKSLSRALFVYGALVFFFSIYTSTYSQNYFGSSHQHTHDEKCATVLYEKKLEEELGIFGSREYFESWVTDRKKVLENQRRTFRTLNEEVRRIPVVVHVIHSGSPIGVGANIPDEQVLSQIEILNEDFRRLNPDTVDTPTEFLGVAGDARIEFVLAKQDPNGLPTNGINRVHGSRQEYPLGFDAVISQLASWPPEDYLNIWVVPLQAPNIGYASFPISNELPGLDFPPTSRMTDGVTIDYRYFGRGGNALSNSRGRTATHEVGHFFGLRHIWGDGGCGVDDFVEDTPEQGSFTVGCPLTPSFSCNSTDMIQNFMDYTSDACMNIFTMGQIERMDVVLAFSPRRNSLLFSRGLEEPVLLENNLAIEKVVEPQDFICQQEVRPRIVVVNYGANPVENAEIQIRVNEVTVQSQTIQLGLEVGQRDTVAFAPVFFGELTGNFFEVEVVKVNGLDDSDPSDNYFSTSPELVSSVSLPHQMNAGNLREWNILNPDNSVTWDPIQLQIDGQQQNMVYFNGYDYDVQGEMDYLISPSFDLSTIRNAQLTFDLAYSPFSSDDFQETLIVAVSLDCGNTFELADYLYNKRHESLSTQPSTSNEFFPQTSSQFRKEVVNLSRYAGEPNVRIGIIATNGHGNNIFIKDLAINRDEIHRYDMKIVEVESPLPVTAGLQENLTIRIENTGNLPIRQFMAEVMLNGRATSTETVFIEDVELNVGESIAVDLPNLLTDGYGVVDFRVYEPNFDQNEGSESELGWFFVQDNNSMPSPWRQSFDQEEAFDSWFSINPEGGFSSWNLFPLADGGGNAVGISYTEPGNSYWLASPVFSLENSHTAALFFDWTGGGFSANSAASLELIVSKDGGASYEVLWKKTGDELNVSGSGLPDVNNPAHFQRQFVDLSNFASYEHVRVYFKLSDHGVSGAEIYLDNIELFFSNNPEPVDPGLNNAKLYPNPAEETFNVVFNLAEFEDIQIRIVSTTGQVVFERDYPMTLNQTYTFDSSLYRKGVYVIVINSQTVSARKKLIIR